MKTINRIAVIAHDGKKAEMVGFLKDNYPVFGKAALVATGTTGRYAKQTGLQVTRLLSVPQGGYAQIAAMVAEGKLDAVIFFRDPLGKHPHEPDVQMLLRLCDLHIVTLATNPRTVQLLLKGLESYPPEEERD